MHSTKQYKCTEPVIFHLSNERAAGVSLAGVLAVISSADVHTIIRVLECTVMDTTYSPMYEP